jgi:threonine synthase
VIASSAGNHAQGVALAAQKLGCSATIVMPSTTPKIKIDAVKARGAEVILHGDTYDEAYAEAKRLERARKLAFVHPYDDPDVIAGQGTIGLEIVRQSSQPPDGLFPSAAAADRGSRPTSSACVLGQGDRHRASRCRCDGAFAEGGASRHARSRRPAPMAAVKGRRLTMP